MTVLLGSSGHALSSLSASSSSSSSSSSISRPTSCWLVVDFDGTCTTDDTTGWLPRMAARNDPDSGLVRMEQWRVLEEEYLTNYATTKSRLLSSFDDDAASMTLEQALEELDTVSTRSTVKVSDQQVLAGVPTTTTGVTRVLSSFSSSASSSNIPLLQEGCLDTLSRALENEWQVRVLSINWSQPLIDSVLWQPLWRRKSRTTTITTSVPTTNDDVDVIWSNHVDDQGRIRLTIPGAVAKQERLRAIRRRDPTAFIVYVGDSATDLLALLEANVGIIVGSSSSLVDVAQRWGITIRTTDPPRPNHDDDDDNRTLWKVGHWNEISRLLSTVEEYYYENDKEDAKDSVEL